jgi:DNA polymerase-4
MSPRKILHLDLDAFFCACEELKDPSLAGKPFAVGGQAGHRGVISSCSYPARKLGVRSAMPTGQALRLCPNLILISGHHADYGSQSRRVMSILADLTPLLEQVSIDEAFLDVTDLPQPLEEIAKNLQARVWAETKLPCSIGGASNKLVAKVATDTGKLRSKHEGYPRAILIVPPGGETEFLAPLPAKAMWGVGPKTEVALATLGIKTLGDLANYPEALLDKHFGKYGRELAERAKGLDDRPIVTEYETKSVSQETTFDRDTNDLEELHQTLRYLAQKVGFRLRQGQVCGKVVRLKLRWSDFSTHTRQVSLPQPTDQDGVILETSLKLLESLWQGDRPVRLIGVGVAGLAPRTHQMSLFDTPNEKERRLLTALDELHEKFGRRSVVSGDRVAKNKPEK